MRFFSLILVLVSTLFAMDPIRCYYPDDFSVYSEIPLIAQYGDTVYTPYDKFVIRNENSGYKMYLVGDVNIGNGCKKLLASDRYLLYLKNKTAYSYNLKTEHIYQLTKDEDVRDIALDETEDLFYIATKNGIKVYSSYEYEPTKHVKTFFEGKFILNIVGDSKKNILAAIGWHDLFVVKNFQIKVGPLGYIEDYTGTEITYNNKNCENILFDTQKNLIMIEDTTVFKYNPQSESFNPMCVIGCNIMNGPVIDKDNNMWFYYNHYMHKLNLISGEDEISSVSRYDEPWNSLRDKKPFIINPAGNVMISAYNCIYAINGFYCEPPVSVSHKIIRHPHNAKASNTKAYFNLQGQIQGRHFNQIPNGIMIQKNKIITTVR